MDNLAVIILTKNEEKNIKDVIKNAQQVTSHIVVVDSGSEDNTVLWAKELGAQVIYRPWDNDFSAQRNFPLDKINTEWVLYLDADERINDTLAQAIKEVLNKKENVMYRFIRKNSAFHKDFNYGVLGPDTVIRMFPSKLVRWKGKVHESPHGDIPIVMLKNGYIQHYTYSSFAQYLDKMNSYSTLGAENNLSRGKGVNVILDIILRPFLAFLKMYILKKGFLEGWLGFVLCINYANYTLNKYVKMKLMEKNNDENS